MLTFGVAVLLAVLAYQRTHSLDVSVRELGSDAPRPVLFVRHAGI